MAGFVFGAWAKGGVWRSDNGRGVDGFVVVADSDVIRNIIRNCLDLCGHGDRSWCVILPFFMRQLQGPLSLDTVGRAGRANVWRCGVGVWGG